MARRGDVHSGLPRKSGGAAAVDEDGDGCLSHPLLGPQQTALGGDSERQVTGCSGRPRCLLLAPGAWWLAGGCLTCARAVQPSVVALWLQVMVEQRSDRGFSFASPVGKEKFWVPNPFTVQDANHQMHLAFRSRLLESVLCSSIIFIAPRVCRVARTKTTASPPATVAFQRVSLHGLSLYRSSPREL